MRSLVGSDSALRGGAARGATGSSRSRSSRRTSTGSSRIATRWSTRSFTRSKRDGHDDLPADDREPASSSASCCSAHARRDASSCRATASARCRSSTRRIRSSSTGAPCGYEPAESSSKLKGGNSNWRGPIWFPTYVPDHRVACASSARRSGRRYVLSTPGSHEQPIGLQRHRERHRAADDRHLPAGRERAAAGVRRREEVPERSALARRLLFYEYFHGDNGAGIGATHQTGWTSLVANLIDEWPKSRK